MNVPAGGEAKGYLQADKAGDDYLVPAGKFTIPGLWAGLQDKIYGQSTDTASFKQLSAQALTDGDIKDASDNLLEAMKAKAIAQLQAKLPTNVQLNADQIVGHITDQAVDAEIGDQVASFTITLTANFDAMIFDPEALLALAKAKLKDQLPDNVSVVTTNDQSFGYALTAINTAAETAEVKVHLEAEVTTGALVKNFINPKTLRGKTATEAEQYLAEQGLPGARVSLSPFWVTHVPQLEDHIIIKSDSN